MDELKRKILNLERTLLESETRRSADEIKRLLSKDFFEFCSSGYIYHYHEDDVFDTGVNPSELEWEIRGFQIKSLSMDTVLATYKLIKQGEVEQDKKYSLRSSIWQYLDGKWKMVFHQGTLTDAI